MSNGEVELLRLQEGVKLHIKASEMNANEKSKPIKLIFFSRTISKSLAGASVDKARDVSLPRMSRRSPKARPQPRVFLTAKLSMALVHSVWISLQDPGMPRKHFEKGRLRP